MTCFQFHVKVNGQMLIFKLVKNWLVQGPNMIAMRFKAAIGYNKWINTIINESHQFQNKYLANSTRDKGSILCY